VNVEALANTNNAGKLSNGWNLTGKTIGEFTPAGGATLREVACPEGSFMYLNLGQGDLWNTVSTSGGLTVTGNGKTVELPNTPVVLPPV
jgi:hypothetical protein